MVINNSCGIIFPFLIHFIKKNTDGQQESKNEQFFQGSFKTYFLYTYCGPGPREDNDTDTVFGDK